MRFRRRRPGALLVWPAPKPPYYGVSLAIGVTMGFLVFYKIFMLRGYPFAIVVREYPLGEVMMFVYYAYLTPLNRRIGRGFYADGIWADTAFIPYHDVGGISWREGEH